MGGDLEERARRAAADVFGPTVAIGEAKPIDDGRGVYSHVVRVETDGPEPSVAVKLVRADANGEVAMASGAVAREVAAYRTLLPLTSEVRTPSFFGTSELDPVGPALVIEDLSPHRFEDQADGLGDADVRSIVAELTELHRTWDGSAALDELDLRRSTPSVMPADAIDQGARLLAERWPELSADRIDAVRSLAAVRPVAVATFASEGGPTLCHGDPRGGNVAFTTDGRAVLFDWQQAAVQFGEADLAWLLATSVRTDVRRSIEADLVASYAIARNQDAATTWRRYVTGMVLPGLAVLLLSQRSIDDERTERFVQVSLERIADAVADLDVARAVSS